ncbi:MAG: hypothetical protein ACE5DX_04635 [Candidatus Dojkabacteria bacterium]
MEALTTAEHLNPIGKMQFFITQLWMHPLLNQDTQSHRLQMRDGFEALLPAELRGKVAAVYTFGSSLWVVGEGSDHDLLVIGSSDEVVNNLNINYSYRLRNAGFQISSASLESFSSSNPNLFGPRNAVQLLSCPDEYAAGNLSILHQARMNAVNTAQGAGQQQDTWEIAEALFRKKYLKWPYNFDSDDALRYGHQLVLKDKEARFRRALFRRSLQEADPRQWRQTYLEQREQLYFPDFETVVAALRESGGAVNLNLRFAEEGQSIFRIKKSRDIVRTALMYGLDRMMR